MTRVVAHQFASLDFPPHPDSSGENNVPSSHRGPAGGGPEFGTATVRTDQAKRGFPGIGDITEYVRGQIVGPGSWNNEGVLLLVICKGG